MTTKNYISIIVPAAGSGSRLGSKTPKPYVLIAGVPLIIRTLQALEFKVQKRYETVVAVEANAIGKTQKMIQRFGMKRCRVIAGGSTRAESVKLSFESLSGQTKLVVIHDGARPFLRNEPVAESIAEAQKMGAAILAKQADATVKQVKSSGNLVDKTLDRSRIYMAQTPQIFTTEILHKSYRKMQTRYKNFTDEAGLVEVAGFSVKVVSGSSMNFKITTPEDLKMAKLLIKHKVG